MNSIYYILNECTALYLGLVKYNKFHFYFKLKMNQELHDAGTFMGFIFIIFMAYLFIFIFDWFTIPLLTKERKNSGSNISGTSRKQRFKKKH